MRFTKRILVEAVIREATIDDVINGGLSGDMDDEFYRAQAAEFWDDLQFLVDHKKMLSEIELKKWAFKLGLNADAIRNIQSVVHDYQIFQYIRDKYTDQDLYRALKDKDILKNDDARIQYVNALLDDAVKSLITGERGAG
jgi:hypothetical protein